MTSRAWPSRKSTGHRVRRSHSGRADQGPTPSLFADDTDTAGAGDTDTDDDLSSGKPYVFHDEEREASSLRGFQGLREAQQLFDVTLTVDGREFECHRSLLASASEYFRCLFTTNLAEHDQPVISISGIDTGSMQLVLDYVYTGKVELSADTVQSLLSSANLFQLKGLRDGCADYMERKIEIDNCIGIHFFAQVKQCFLVLSLQNQLHAIV
jgi:hypothetical protein